MQHQGNVELGGDSAHHVLLDVRGALVHAVRGAHADGQRGAAGALDELHGLIGIGVGVLALDGRAVILFAANLAKLGLHGHAHGGTGVGDQLGEGDVVLEQLVASVDHDGGVTGAQGLHAAVVAVAVVEMQGNGNLGALGRGLDHAVEVIEAGGLDGARGGLHDDGGLGLLGGLEDSHHELEVLDVEGADAVVVLLGVEQHFLGGNEHGCSLLPSRTAGTRARAPRTGHPLPLLYEITRLPAQKTIAQAARRKKANASPVPTQRRPRRAFSPFAQSSASPAAFLYAKRKPKESSSFS